MTLATKPTVTGRIEAQRTLAADPGRACRSCQGTGTMPSWERGPDFVDQCTHCNGLGTEPATLACPS